MTSKQMALEAIQRLDDNATLTEVRERIELLEALEKARDSVAKGEYVTQDEVERQFAEWAQQWNSK